MKEGADWPPASRKRRTTPSLVLSFTSLQLPRGVLYNTMLAHRFANHGEAKGAEGLLGF